jgi:hypothetical protein
MSDSLKSADAIAPDLHQDDASLVSRIVAAYKNSVGRFSGHGNSMWARLNSMNHDIHTAAIESNLEILSELLRSPHRTDLFYGFDFLARSLALPSTDDERAQHSRAVHKMLADLCEVTGAVNAARDLSAEALISRLDEVLGFRVDFPNPFPYEPGLRTSRGIISSRALGALYQTWRIMTLVKGSDRPKVLEIGAGLGRTAYYSYKAGIRDFTIIDLPMANIAQANFLGRVLPEQAISLAGERDRGEIIIEDVSWAPAADDWFDLVMNIDSLTEMDRGHAERYIEITKDRTGIFFSVNKETNSFTVKELWGDTERTTIRNKYCLRAGYIEEIIYLNSERSRNR